MCDEKVCGSAMFELEEQQEHVEQQGEELFDYKSNILSRLPHVSTRLEIIDTTVLCF